MKNEKSPKPWYKKRRFAIVALCIVACVAVVAVLLQKDRLSNTATHSVLMGAVHKALTVPDRYQIIVQETQMTLDTDGNSYRLHGELKGAEFEVIIMGQDIYIKFASAEAFYDDSALAQQPDTFTSTAKVRDELVGMNGQWIKADIATLRASTGGMAQLQCGLETLQNLPTSDTNNQWGQIVQAYDSHPFASVVDTKSEADGTLYTVKIQQDKLQSFAKAFEQTDYYESLKRCKNVSLFASEQPWELTMKALVSSDDRRVKSLTLESPSAPEQAGIQLVPDYGEKVGPIATPDATLDYEEVMRRLTGAMSGQ